MNFFDSEIKHLNGFKYNCGERVKNYINFNNCEEHDPHIKHGRNSKRVSQINLDDPYDPNVCSSFYYVSSFVDSHDFRGDLDDAKEQERILEFLNQQDI